MRNQTLKFHILRRKFNNYIIIRSQVRRREADNTWIVSRNHHSGKRLILQQIQQRNKYICYSLYTSVSFNVSQTSSFSPVPPFLYVIYTILHKNMIDYDHAYINHHKTIARFTQRFWSLSHNTHFTSLYFFIGKIIYREISIFNK